MPDLPLVERRPASAASRNAAADKFLADITTLLPDIRARAGADRAPGCCGGRHRSGADGCRRVSRRAAAPMGWSGTGSCDVLRGHGSDRLRLRRDRLGGERRRGPSLAGRPVRQRGPARGLGRRAGCADRLVPGAHRCGPEGRWRIPHVRSLAFFQRHRSLRWVLLGAVVPDEGSGAEFRTFLVPRRDFSIDHESWQRDRPRRHRQQGPRRAGRLRSRAPHAQHRRCPSRARPRLRCQRSSLLPPALAAGVRLHDRRTGDRSRSSARSMPSSTTTACAYRPMADRRLRWTPL